MDPNLPVDLPDEDVDLSTTESAPPLNNPIEIPQNPDDELTEEVDA